MGFLPEKKGEKRAVLEKFKDTEATLLFHVAPQDLDGDIRAMYEVFGERKAAAVREITKIHEESAAFLLSEGLPGRKARRVRFSGAGRGKKGKSAVRAFRKRTHSALYARGTR